MQISGGYLPPCKGVNTDFGAGLILTPFGRRRGETPEHARASALATFFAVNRRRCARLGPKGRAQARRHRLTPEQTDCDQGRTDLLPELGRCVLRFPNERILDDPAAVLAETKAGPGHRRTAS